MQRNPQHQLALDLLQQGNLQQAIPVFERALHEGESSELWSDWGVAQATAGQVEAASRSFRRALELNPQNQDATQNLEALNSPAPAAENPVPVQSANDRGAALHQRAKKCFREGRIQDAAQAICKALEFQENSSRWNDYGTIALALASVEEAERGYRRAVELDEKNSLAATNLVVLLARLKRFEEADQFRHLTDETRIAEQEKQVKEVYRRYEAAHLD